MRITSEQFIERHGSPIPNLEALLAKALRFVKAEADRVGVSLDGRDPELVADVVCQMVHETASAPAIGVESVQQSAGPFSQSISYANPAGRLFLSRDARRLLGLDRKQSVFSVRITSDDHAQ